MIKIMPVSWHSWLILRQFCGMFFFFTPLAMKCSPTMRKKGFATTQKHLGMIQMDSYAICNFKF